MTGHRGWSIVGAFVLLASLGKVLWGLVYLSEAVSAQNLVGLYSPQSCSCAPASDCVLFNSAIYSMISLGGGNWTFTPTVVNSTLPHFNVSSTQSGGSYDLTSIDLNYAANGTFVGSLMSLWWRNIATGSECTVTLTQNSAPVCQYTTCGDCISNHNGGRDCGWCSDGGGRCIPGTYNGPLPGSSCSSEWVWDTCHGASLFANVCFLVSYASCVMSHDCSHAALQDALERLHVCRACCNRAVCTAQTRPRACPVRLSVPLCLAHAASGSMASASVRADTKRVRTQRSHVVVCSPRPDCAGGRLLPGRCCDHHCHCLLLLPRPLLPLLQAPTGTAE